MDTQILPMYDPETLRIALDYLNRGQVIAGPTDTIYGLFCRYDHAEAIQQLYQVKGRPLHKAIPVLLGNQEQLTDMIQGPIPPLTQPLIERFWPGPLTLILTTQRKLPEILTAGKNTIAVRMPDHKWLCSLIEQTGPVTGTSANFSEGPEACTALDVQVQLNGRLPLIVDGGRTSHDRASTIVDLSMAESPPRILRPGPIAQQVTELLNLGSELQTSDN